MMSSQATSKIVIGVGLAVVWGLGIWFFVVKQGTQSQAAHNPPAAAASNDQTATNSPAPNALAPNQTAPGASASAPNAATASVAPPADASPASLATNPPVAAKSAATNQAAINGTNDANSGNDANENAASSNDTDVLKPKHASRRGAQARIDHGKKSSSSLGDDSSMRVASAANEKKSSAPPNDSQSSLETNRGDTGVGVTSPSSPPANDAVTSSGVTPVPGASAPASDAEAKPASEASASGAEMDGRITAEVQSSIASLAPGSDIDVKTMSGIVMLTGSVPSQDVVERARQAAQQIAGVKQVDTSALTVTNQ